MEQKENLNNETKKEKKKSSAVIIVIILLVVALAGGLLLYKTLSGNKETNNNDNKTTNKTDNKTINTLVERLNNIFELSELNDDSYMNSTAKWSLKLDKEKNKLTISYDDNNSNILELPFNYTEDYIECDTEISLEDQSLNISFDTSDSNINDDSNKELEKFAKTFANNMAIHGYIMENILNMNGYTIFDDVSDYEYKDYTNTFDKYGIEYKIENNTIKHFKMSFDKNKIENFMNKLGVKESNYKDDEFNKELEKLEELRKKKEEYLKLIPKVEIGNVTSSSVAVAAKVDVPSNINYDSTILCQIYRSTEKNGKYEKIENFNVNCQDLIYTIDNNLKSNTTYYYKASVVNGTNFSEIVEVNTK